MSNTTPPQVIELTAPTTQDESAEDDITALFNEDTFETFRKFKEQERNRQEGYDDTRNNPSHTPDPTDESPSGLFKCHRQSFYKANGAPREDRHPYGIFKFGHDFEEFVEEWIEYLLQGYWNVLNTVNIEYETEVSHNDTSYDLNISGTTDPVILNPKGNPHTLFEVKTTGGLHHVEDDGINAHHKAQAHAYAEGLKRKFNLSEHPDIVFLYGCRETMDIELFEIEFDHSFWKEVKLWAHDNIEYQFHDELPPALLEDHPRLFQCKYCSFKERCGNVDPSTPRPYNMDIDEDDDEEDKSADSYWYDDTMPMNLKNKHEDIGARGFLPAKIYPIDVVISHLLIYDDIKLTPTLAAEYPVLVDNNQNHPHEEDRLTALYGECPQCDVYHWHCSNCNTTIPYHTIDWDGNIYSMPGCPNCEFNNIMRGPHPNEQ